jgi:hypothetical protein
MDTMAQSERIREAVQQLDGDHYHHPQADFFLSLAKRKPGRKEAWGGDNDDH